MARDAIAVENTDFAGAPESRENGRRCVADTHPFASLFIAPPWVSALTQTYGFEITTSVVAQQGRADGLVYFSRISDFRGDRVLSLPFCDYCDPLVDDAGAWTLLADRLLSFGTPVTLRCLRNSLPARDSRFERVGAALWHGVDLTRSEEAIWAGLTGSARQNIRKAERNEVTVRIATGHDAVRLFHHMHCHVRKRKYRLLAQPLAFFENIYDAFAPQDAVMLLLAEREGTAIAGLLLLQWRDTLYYKFNASVETGLGANDLLAWHAIRFGRGRGLVQMDFGRSDYDQPGLVRYKRKYASEEQEIVTLRYEPPGYRVPHGEETGQVLSRMTELLTRPEVPDAISRAAGDALYRYFC